MSSITSRTATALFVALLVIPSSLAFIVATGAEPAAPQLSDQSRSTSSQLAPVTASGAWESFRGGPTHLGDSALNGPSGGLAIWTLRGTFNPAFSSPVQAPSGTIYQASDGGIQAISSDGRAVWYSNGQTIHGHHHGTHGGSAVLATPSISPSGNVVFGAENGQIFAVSSTGRNLWTFTTSGPIESSAALAANGTIYVGSDDGRLYAISPNGSLVWSFASFGAIRSSPAVAPDGSIYFGSLDGNLYALLPNGTLSWSFPTGAGVFSSPTVTSGGQIIFGSEDDRVYSLFSNGTQAWNFSTHGPVDSSPALGADGSILIGSRDGTLYDLATNGTLRWTVDTGADIVSAPAVDGNGTIYVGSTSGMLYALSPSGRTIWAQDLFAPIASSPTVGLNGTLLIVVSGLFLSLGTRFTAVFHEAGLVPGTTWSVNLSGQSNSSATNRISFTAQELAPLQVASWKVFPASISCGGGCVVIPVPDTGSFVVKHSLVVNITYERRTVVFQETGLPNGTLWNVAIGSYSAASRSNQISFTNSTFSFTSSYTYTVTPSQVSCGKGCELEPSPSTGTTGVMQPVLLQIHFLPLFLVQFNRTTNHGGSMSPAPGSSRWVTSGGTVSLSATSGILVLFSHWASSSPSIVIANPNATSTSATIGGPGNLTAVFVTLIGSGGSGTGAGQPSSAMGQALSAQATVLGRALSGRPN